MAYLEIILILLLLLFCYSFRNKNGCPTNWPLVGMIPSLVKNLHRNNDFFTEVFQKSNKLTFIFKGPWFTNTDIVFTADPNNVHHVMTKNFASYEKGQKFSVETLDIMGETLMTSSNPTVWKDMRAQAQCIFEDSRFQQFWVAKLWEKIENGLIPVLDHVSKQGLEVDMQDLFSRFAFDFSCTMMIDYDPRSLTIDFPPVPSMKAIDDVAEAMFRRLIMPAWIWKLQRWVGIGLERRYREAWQTLDTFIYKCLARKREEIRNQMSKVREGMISHADMMALFMTKIENQNKDEKHLRDSMLSTFFAGRDTISTALCWFFYLLSKNPRVLSKIREEIDVIYNLSRNLKEVSNNLVYLHAALCEALRLYPPVPSESKTAIKPDILPSGHKVNRNLPIFFCSYAMGRMKSIWGDDCCEFKPERWITEEGKIRHEPSYKFFVFMAGPRTCLGKHMAMTQLKAVAATIIRNYNIQPVEGHPIVPAASIMLCMKYGFRAKVLSRV